MGRRVLGGTLGLAIHATGRLARPASSKAVGQTHKLTEQLMSDYELPIDKHDLQSLAPVQQADVMRSWFRSRFEDPAERTPFESKEGGYQWIQGGPYSAHEELGNEFGGSENQGAIEDLVRELENECVQWSPTEQPGDYEDFYCDASVDNLDVYKKLQWAIDRTLALNAGAVG